MENVELGTSGIEVSAMGIGNVDFGTKIDEATAFRVLDEFVDLGGTFVDTSNNYAQWNPGGRGGECESVIGRWMRARRNRDRIILATKVGAFIHELPGDRDPDGYMTADPFSRGEGLSRTAIRRAVDESLQRLQTDHIDLYYAHVEDTSVEVTETLETFAELQRDGKIRAIGASNHSIWRVERAKQISRQHGWPEYCCVQDAHSYIKPMASKRRRFATNDTLDYCASNPDTTLIAYTPTIWGKLAKPAEWNGAEFWGEFYSRDTDARLSALMQVATNRGMTPVQVVLAWIMQSSPGAIPLIATKSPEHLRENVEAADLQLGDEEIALLDSAGVSI